MKRFIPIIAVLFLALILSACGKGTYEEGYEAGYEEGRRNGYQTGQEEGHKSGYDRGYTDGYCAAGGSRADAILSKYGIEQVRGSENNTPTTDSSVADALIEKYNGGPSSHVPPDSGTILSGTEHNGSEITVTADSNSHYVVSLKNSSGIERLSFFVRSGDTVTVGVPAEHLNVYFASGRVWYGYGKGLMFGEDTVYSKDDDLIDFTKYTWEYTLYPVYDGNFSETPSDESEFFE